MSTDPTPRSRHTVPVVSRSKETPRPKWKRPTLRFNTVEFGMLAAVAIIIIGTIWAPANNYFQGRSEIARLEESIVAKQEEKERLLDEIDRYQDEAFIREEARRRLGLIEPGEVAFRVIDPGMESDGTVTTSAEELAAERTWHEILWDSIATPPEADLQQAVMEE
ncbi:MAG: septum formation initiator family protein [Corynebacterium sp.]|uniref:septum formation initiator family protein n=1 Tax=Corynebacterium sp. TaxID=1720 RepID=UPI0026DF4A14|nr:septum formation initiator family protein [Corynebacterium sp.]MDO5668538.1 septum formation initiator family protein [Corynebacterium sp.]